MTSPLEKYNKVNAKRWNILVDIPAWEQNSVMNWVHNVFVAQKSDTFGVKHGVFDSSILRTIERKNRLMVYEEFGITNGSWTDVGNRLWKLIEKEPEKFIFFLELLVVYVRDDAPKSVWYGGSVVSDKRALEVLQSILSNGSKWKVVEKYKSSAGLIEVVSPQLRKAAEKLDSDDLDQAWEAAFQPHPNPELAIEKAQLAVEHLASEYKLTKATTKVYGTLLGDIRTRKNGGFISVAKPEFDLSNELAGEKSSEQDINEQFADWFWTAMNLVQKTHPARHKSNKTTAFKVSPEAARQAVLIATLLGELIKEGYIFRIADKPKSTSKTD